MAALTKSEQRRRDARALVSQISKETGNIADPLEFLLRVVANDGLDYETRAEAARSTLPFVHPKLANVQHTGENGGPIEVRAIQAIMLDPATAALAEQLAFSISQKTSELAGNGATVINLPSASATQPDSPIARQIASGSDEEAEVVAQDARPVDHRSPLDADLDSSDDPNALNPEIL